MRGIGPLLLSVISSLRLRVSGLNPKPLSYSISLAGSLQLRSSSNRAQRRKGSISHILKDEMTLESRGLILDPTSMQNNILFSGFGPLFYLSGV